MDESFQQYLQRPENRVLAESHQRRQVLKAIKQEERASALEFRAKVLDADLETQKSIAPLLQNKALRKVVHTFTNDEGGDMGRWACNPEVLRLLYEAKRRMDEGFITEAEMERLLLGQLKDDASKQNIANLDRQHTTLSMEDLASALNEHLTERRRGNEFYHQKNLTAAKYHYERARHIVDFIKGQDTATQNEIDANFVAISLNLAALSLASKEPSKAVKFCTEALRRQEKHPKALLRRAKAYLKMHEYQATEADLTKLKHLGAWDLECEKVGLELMDAKRTVKKAESDLFSRMLS